MIFKALSGSPKEQILFGDHRLDSLSPKIEAIAQGDYRLKQEDEIRGTGYVVESLEAALWCFQSTSSFSDAILKAVDLGDDADTTAAVCGQIAGAFYGETAIPESWRNKLAMCDEIREMASKLYTMGRSKMDDLTRGAG